MGNKDKDKEQNSNEAMIEGVDSTHNACHASQDLSRERAATLDRIVAEAIARVTAWITVTLPAILNKRTAVNLPESLKVTSRAAGFKAMTPFDWTRDKTIYHRWQQWSEKARYTLEAMEGDSEKAKISYFHHWKTLRELLRLSHGRTIRHF